MANVLPGRLALRWHAAPIPESPAPTIRPSTGSVIAATVLADHHFGRCVSERTLEGSLVSPDHLPPQEPPDDRRPGAPRARVVGEGQAHRSSCLRHVL